MKGGGGSVSERREGKKGGKSEQSAIEIETYKYRISFSLISGEEMLTSGVRTTG